jgi:hypothetical protein
LISANGEPAAASCSCCCCRRSPRARVEGAGRAAFRLQARKATASSSYRAELCELLMACLRAASRYAYMRYGRYGTVRGALLNFLGVTVAPPPPPFASAIKCHHKSTSNSAGSSVGSLAHPRATPRLLCRASTSLAPLYSPCAISAFDWGSKPHSRSAPAPVESSPGLVLWPVSVTPIQPVCPSWLTKARAAKSRPIGCDYSQPAHASPNLISSPTKSQEVT